MSLQYYWSKFCLKLRGRAIRNSNIDRTAFVNSGCNVVNSSLDRYSYLGYDCWIIDAEIGSFCSISNYVHIGGPSHPVEFVSTSPVFHQGVNIFGKHFSEHEYNPYKHTTIGNDVWIGESALIKAGVTIGNGAVIGMGSVVARDVGAYEIWAGNPAKFIRRRFDETMAKALDDSQWWSWTDSRLERAARYFDAPETFIRMMNNDEAEA